MKAKENNKIATGPKEPVVRRLPDMSDLVFTHLSPSLPVELSDAALIAHGRNVFVLGGTNSDGKKNTVVYHTVLDKDGKPSDFKSIGVSPELGNVVTYTLGNLTYIMDTELDSSRTIYRFTYDEEPGVMFMEEEEGLLYKLLSNNLKTFTLNDNFYIANEHMAPGAISKIPIRDNKLIWEEKESCIVNEYCLPTDAEYTIVPTKKLNKAYVFNASPVGSAPEERLYTSLELTADSKGDLSLKVLTADIDYNYPEGVECFNLSILLEPPKNSHSDYLEMIIIAGNKKKYTPSLTDGYVNIKAGLVNKDGLVGDFRALDISFKDIDMSLLNNNSSVNAGDYNIIMGRNDTSTISNLNYNVLLRNLMSRVVANYITRTGRKLYDTTPAVSIYNAVIDFFNVKERNANTTDTLALLSKRLSNILDEKEKIAVEIDNISTDSISKSDAIVLAELRQKINKK